MCKHGENLPVQIVIVNYRTADLVVDCLRSLVTEIETVAGCRIVVVDGGSGDGSAERLANAVQVEGWSGCVELLLLTENRGFAVGNNAAIRPLLEGPNSPDYVLLLNPDTVVRPGAIRALVEFMDAHPRVGIAGSRLEDPDGTPQRSAFRFPTVASEFDSGMRLGLVSRLLQKYVVAPPVRNDAHPTDWVAGASMMIRWPVIAAVGLLDESYFLYFEETDYCLQARRAGWQCWYVPSSRVVHLVGQSSGVTNPKNRPKRMPRYWFDSRRRYYHKNHGFVYMVLASAAWLFGYAIWRVRSWLQRKPNHLPAYFVRDFVQYTLFP
jgi:GT2 family glycosyltransferase